MIGLSAHIAEHVARANAPPHAVLEAAKRSLMDAIGVSLGANSAGAGVEAFVNFARNACTGGQSSILGHHIKVSTSLAAFANGAMAHALDYEDALDGAPLHPNAALTPTVLALAQARTAVSGVDLLTAMAIGCDLSCRLALSLRTPMEQGGWYPPPILGAFGAAAGGARVVGLNARGVLDAFSIMLCQIGCSGEIKHAPDSTIRAVRDAFAAQAAVLAVDLASARVRGFEAPLEGECGFFRLFAGGDYDPAVILDRLGDHYYGVDLSFKPWPACRGTHPFIEAAIYLRDTPEFRLDQIESIVMRGHRVQQMLAQPLESKRAPRTAIAAKFSLPYTCARALMSGSIGLNDFSPDALADARTRAFADMCSFEVDTTLASASSGRLVLRYRDGSVQERSVISPRGAPNNPLSWDDIVAKALQCAQFGRLPDSERRILSLASVVQTLEDRADATADIFEALDG